MTTRSEQPAYTPQQDEIILELRKIFITVNQINANIERALKLMAPEPSTPATAPRRRYGGRPPRAANTAGGRPDELHEASADTLPKAQAFALKSAGVWEEYLTGEAVDRQLSANIDEEE